MNIGEILAQKLDQGEFDLLIEKLAAAVADCPCADEEDREPTEEELAEISRRIEQCEIREARRIGRTYRLVRLGYDENGSPIWGAVYKSDLPPDKRTLSPAELGPHTVWEVLRREDGARILRRWSLWPRRRTAPDGSREEYWEVRLEAVLEKRDPSGGWECRCREFREHGDCRHIPAPTPRDPDPDPYYWRASAEAEQCRRCGFAVVLWPWDLCPACRLEAEQERLTEWEMSRRGVTFCGACHRREARPGGLCGACSRQGGPLRRGRTYRRYVDPVGNVTYRITESVVLPPVVGVRSVGGMVALPLEDHEREYERPVAEVTVRPGGWLSCTCEQFAVEYDCGHVRMVERLIRSGEEAGGSAEAAM